MSRRSITLGVLFAGRGSPRAARSAAGAADEGGWRVGRLARVFEKRLAGFWRIPRCISAYGILTNSWRPPIVKPAAQFADRRASRSA